MLSALELYDTTVRGSRKPPSLLAPAFGSPGPERRRVGVRDREAHRDRGRAVVPRAARSDRGDHRYSGFMRTRRRRE